MMRPNDSVFAMNRGDGNMNHGIEARDYIAICMMQGILSRGGIAPAEAAAKAYDFADALIDRSHFERPRPRVD